MSTYISNRCYNELYTGRDLHISVYTGEFKQRNSDFQSKLENYSKQFFGIQYLAQASRQF